MTNTELRNTLVSCFSAALAALRFDQITASWLGSLPRPEHVRLIAVGKGAQEMAAGALHALKDSVREGLVVCTELRSTRLPHNAIRQIEAAHPIPDNRSEHAAQAALDLAARTPRDATLLVLVSGGASSLLCAPPLGLTLDQKQKTIDALLRCGASIQQINLVRRHLSRVKGGRLALATQARVLCGVASDVVCGAPQDVGSGPACADPTTALEAFETAWRTLGEKAAEQLRPFLSQGLSPSSEDAQRVQLEQLVGPEDLGKRLALKLQEQGFHATFEVLQETTAAQLSDHLIAQARSLSPGDATTITCEPTLALPASCGRGGRAGWVGLRTLLSEALPEDVAILCGASDGRDGASGTAGVCVSRDVLAAQTRGAIAQALKDFDDASAHHALGTQIRTGPTGINLTDVYVCARRARG